MKNTLRLIGLFAMLAILPAVTRAQSETCPMHDQHQQASKHHNEVNVRGDHAMGFSHAKTTHHFRLTESGGVIEVSANDKSDVLSRDQIRLHLQHIAVMFSEGDFATPMFIHGTNPPGIETMKRSKAVINYRFEEMESGAIVRISTADRDAMNAIHEFLRFQIKDHATGDPTDLGNKSDLKRDR